MSQEDLLKEQIIALYDQMPPQLQKAARYILENPQEVALISMRSLARNADVQPATMTRLAKFVGLVGYEDIRTYYAKALRIRADGFAARAIEREFTVPDQGSALARQMFQSLAAQIMELSKPEKLTQIQAVADYLNQARRIYVLGLRSCHSVAWNFHYVMTLLGEKTIHLDGPAGTGGDGLVHATDKDVLLVISISPYASYSLELAGAAREQGVTVIAITDSEVSPLIAISETAVLCSTESQTFFHTLTPTLALSEVLCGLLASHDRQGALEALQKADRHLLMLNTYANNIPRRRI